MWEPFLSCLKISLFHVGRLEGHTDNSATQGCCTFRNVPSQINRDHNLHWGEADILRNVNSESILKIRMGGTSDRQVLDLCAVGSHRISLTCPENKLRPRQSLVTLYREFRLFLCEGMLMLLTALFSTVYEMSCIYVCVSSRVQLFATPWTVARQAPLSMGLSRREYWVAIPFSRGSSQPRD